MAVCLHAGVKPPPLDVLAQFNLRGAAAEAVTVAPMTLLEAAAADAALAAKQARHKGYFTGTYPATASSTHPL